MNDLKSGAPVPEGRVYILCQDSRFAKAMAHEVRRMGITVSVIEDPLSIDEETLGNAILVLADGDDGTEEMWLLLRRRSDCPWICWSRCGVAVPDAVCLRRPFDLADFTRAVSACLGGGVLPSIVPPVPSIEADKEIRAPRDGVLSVRNQEVTLTPYEWAVYQCLHEHRGETVSRETLRALLGDAGGNTVDVYVCHLRAKLEKPLGVRLITTVRGQGYRMEKA